ncbi:MarR family winged helix-turn-helix transcriptional regulator [Lentzea sp. HUAS12]|uniref:MarR family winged helix-turn-helix transcriptional regulator n=1 Tax=Lentzea sp. HUAS12 TaxID=2951806 RepID=UPI00209CE76C|nr:MarR family transcriptional regulator [Lentzea sp. HUAS12]USX55544.1 MarR family transcriptional regulator [Lentzea sp. HUAS12]
MSLHQEVLDQVRAVAAVTTRLGDAFAQATGLNRTDATALAMVMDAGAAGDDIGPSQLARQLRVTTAATTTLVDRLVAAGHLERVPDPSDRRRLVLRITTSALSEGREFFGSVNTALLTATSGFTADELDVVARYLGVVRATIEQHQPET